MALTQKTNHVEEGLSLIITRYKKHPRYVAFLTVLFEEIQAIEDAAWQLYEAFALLNATGHRLDLWGERLNLTRAQAGLTDEDDDAYRIRLFGKIAARISHGNEPAFFNLLRSLGLTDVKIWDVYPASMTINFVFTHLILGCECIRTILNEAKQPIQLDFVAHSSQGFGFLGDQSAFGFDVGQLGATA